ncbi:MAG: hypothetical protein QOH43_2589 [Solirubrobacteraceae bacterium]|jgi:uncharacterized protein (DUF2267 family)|nr:hypothetical protein [Solirubrobacteraceae bacterium]
MGTGYADFIETVEQQASLPHDQAERATRATLQTLAERITAGEAHDLAERLPEELRDVLDRDSGVLPLSREDFVWRVHEREDVPFTTAERHVRAVLTALREAVGHDEIADLASELPADLDALLFDRPLPDLGEPFEGPVTTEGFVDRVARRTGLDEAGARRATDAVLQRLAEQIAQGEVDDLSARLPAGLRAPLEAGKTRPGVDASPLPLRFFLIAVSETESTTRAAARLHTRAVLATLEDAVGWDELADVLSQLPNEYRSLVPRPVL